jgi:D-alanyl-D-alanine carboxypeptidase
MTKTGRSVAPGKRPARKEERGSRNPRTVSYSHNGPPRAQNRTSIRRAAFAAVACFVSFASAASTASASASEPLTLTPALTSRIDAALGTGTDAGPASARAVSVAIVENGALVYARAAGDSDVTKNTAATAATRFRAGSVTKMFTAVAVLQLVESGRIKIDDPLATYLPAAPHAKEVTLRQLLTHSSGIPNYLDAALASGATATRTTPQGILDFIAAKPLEFVPGQRFGYSNTGYVLLGLVVEKVTGQSLAAYEAENILKRAGMTETTFGSAPPGVPVATGYMDAKDTTVARVDPSWTYAAGDLVTTASDLGRFDIALMAGTLVASPTFARMATSGIAASADGRGYGFGMTLRQFGPDQLVGHHGGVPGFEAVDEMLPDKHFGVIVLGNSFAFDTSRVENPIFAALLPEGYVAFTAAERRAADAVAASADPRISALLRSFVNGLERGAVDRGTLSEQMNVALTADVVTALHGQFARLGPLTALVFKGKTVDGAYDLYEYSATFTTGAQTIPLRLVTDGAGKIEGFYQA